MRKFYILASFCALFLFLITGNTLKAQTPINSNTGFETWTNIRPDGWTGKKTSIDTIHNLSKVITGAYEGNNACKLRNTASANNQHKRFATQALPVDSGVSYIISFWIKGAGKIRTALYDNRSGGGFSSYNSWHIVNSTSYIHYTDTVKAKVNFAEAEFIFSVLNTDTSAGDLILDKAEIFALIDTSTVAAPVISLQGTQVGSLYSGPVTVSMSCATESASIYYTLDGSTPTSASTLYTSSFTVENNCTIKAFATKTGMDDSPVSSKTVNFGTYLWYEDFESDSLGIFTQQNVVGTTKLWHNNSHCAYMNAYTSGSTEASEDWLISPLVTPNSAEGIIVTFSSATQFDGPAVQLLYSTDYSGTGNPNVATWTNITDSANWSSGNFSWAASGDVHIAGAQALYFAYKYTCTTQGSAGWKIDNIGVQVLGTPTPPVPQPTLTASVNATQFMPYDTLRFSVDVQNFDLNHDGYLMVGSLTLPQLYFGIPDTIIYLDSAGLSQFTSSNISPISPGFHIVSFALVDTNLTLLNPNVQDNVMFLVSVYNTEKPTFTPTAGTYADSVVVSMNCTTENAEIRYTTDGSEPEATSTLYNAPFTLYSNATIKAKAFMNSEYWNDSDVAEATYVIAHEPVLTASPDSLFFHNLFVPTESFTVNSAFLTNPIALSCNNSLFTLSQDTVPANQSAVVSVTFNGSEPATGLITISGDSLTAYVHLIGTATLPTPTINPADGTTDTLIVVTMACSVASATIYYTTDGTYPNENSNIYTSPITLDSVGTYTFQAKAILEGWDNSDIVEATYTIIEPTPVYNDSLMYSVGFESEEGFTATQIYNNQSVVYSGPTGKQWGTIYGTPSTTSPINGSASMQMRWYTNAASTLGYTYTNFDIRNVTRVTFNAKNTNDLQLAVSYSTDGGNTYTGEEIFEINSSARNYSYFVSETGEHNFVRLKFAIILPEDVPSSTSRLYIDSVCVFGIPGIEVHMVEMPVVTPNSGNYISEQTVSMTCATEDAEIRYTLDGTEPTATSTLYTAPFTVNTTTTIKAKGFKENFEASNIASVTLNFPVEVSNIAAFKAANSATNPTVYKITGDVEFVFRSGKYTFVRDNTASLLIFDNTNSVITTEYEEGDVISGGIIGLYSKYHGMVEMVPVANTAESTSNVGTINPTVATITDIKDYYEETYESMLVKVEHVTFVDAEHFVFNGDTLTLFDRFSTVDDVTPGTEASVIGFIARNDATYQLYPRDNEDIIEEVGIEEFGQDVRIYPNPANNYITIDLAGQNMQRVELFSVTGQLLYSAIPTESVITLSMEQYAAGTYFLRMTDGKNSVTRKISKID